MNFQMFPCDLLVLSNCMKCFKSEKSASSGAFPGLFFSRTDMVGRKSEEAVGIKYIFVA